MGQPHPFCVEVELPLDGRLLVVDRGRTLLDVPASPDLDQLRGIIISSPTGPRPAPTEQLN